MDKSWYERDAENFVALKRDLEWAYQIFTTKLGSKNPDFAEYIIVHLGNGYVKLEEYEGAKRIFEEGVRIGATSPKVAKFNDYGSLYLTLKNYPEAIKIFRKGLRFPNLPPVEIPLLLLNESESLVRLDSFDQALASNQRAAPLIEAMKGHRSYARYTTGLLENYALIYHGLAKTGNRYYYPVALSWYDRTLAFATDPEHKAANRDIAGYKIAKAELLSDWGRHAEALKTCHEAVRLVIPNFKGDFSDNPKADALPAEKMLYKALHGKARAFLALNQLDKALECYELIPIVEAKLRATHSYEASSLHALKESRRRFEEAVDIAWQLFERSKGDTRYAARAFRLAEMARGMLLLQSLVQARDSLPVHIRDKEYDLRVRLAWLKTELAAHQEDPQNADSLKIQDLERQQLDLNLERQKLLADYPAYNSPDSLVFKVLAAKEVRALLRPGQAMVDYFLTGTAAYIFSFDANGDVHWRKVMLPAQFREQTGQFAAYLWKNEEAGREQFLRHAWLLDSILLAPERARWGHQASSVIVVPDDLLLLVPFEVLLSRRPAEGQWRDQAWLLADYNFGYAYSATLLNIQQSISNDHARSVEKPRHTFGGFAPSYSNSSEYKLKSTRPMVKNVRDMLGGKAWLDTDASEERFKNSAANCQTLLLAMHGFSNNERPELSHLLFGDTLAGSVINNNKLYTSELQIMRLQADLVVLSACHSGAGKLEMGEGVYSLARAFASARVPATVMSLWLLHGETSQPILEAFFKYLQQGKTKDEALRLAKLDFLHNDDNGETMHPFYWACLSATGDMRALGLPAAPPFVGRWWWLLVAAGIVGMAFWWWKTRGKAKTVSEGFFT